MFIVRWIRTLASLPILWLGELFARFSAALSVPLLKTAWAVGRDPEVGREALSIVRRLQGMPASTALAESWLARYRRPQFAATAGLLALERNDVDRAALMLQAGQTLGDDPLGGLDWLEYLIADRRGEAKAVRQAMASRHDLPPQLSHLLLVDAMYDALLQGQFDQAQLRAIRLLDIAEDPHAEAVLWALAQRDRDARRAAEHFDRVSLSPPERTFCQVLGYTAIGAQAEAAEAMATLREQDERLAKRAELWLIGREPRVI